MSKFKSAPLPRMSHAEARALVKELSRKGFVLSGQDTKGHWQMMHPSSPEKILIPSTPRGNSWKPRARQQADRILGITHQGKAKQRQAVKGSGFGLRRSRAEVEQTQNIDRLVSLCNQSYEKLDAFRDGEKTRAAAIEARETLLTIAKAEKALRCLYQPPPRGEWLVSES